MSDNLEVFDAVEILSKYPEIAVRISGKTYRVENTLNAAKMGRLSDIENEAEKKEAEKKEDFLSRTRLLEEYLDVADGTFKDVDLRVVTRTLNHIQAELKEQSEGKSGTPTGRGQKRSRKSSRRSPASSK